MKVCFGEKLLKRCPIVFCVMEEVKPEPEPEPDKVCPEKVVVLGPGLTNAFCGEEAEFTVDGSTAGPGKGLARVTVSYSQPTIHYHYCSTAAAAAAAAAATSYASIISFISGETRRNPQ